MSMRFPMLALKASSGQGPSNAVGVGFMLGSGPGQFAMGFPALPIVIGVGGQAVSDPLWVAGFDNFMLIDTFTSSGGTSMSFEYLILDPVTLAVLAARQIAVGVVAGTNLVQTFGASSQTAAVATRGDTWIVFQLRLTASGAGGGCTFTYINLWCGVR